jgi:hypothetical protein
VKPQKKVAQPRFGVDLQRRNQREGVAGPPAQVLVAAPPRVLPASRNLQNVLAKAKQGR